MGRAIWEKGAPTIKYRYFAMSCAKTAEPIKMPFGLLTAVGPRNNVLGRCTDPRCEGAIIRGRTCRCMPEDTLP